MQDALRIADKADVSRQAMSTSPQTDLALLPNAAPQEKKRVTRRGTLGRGRLRQGGIPVKPSSFVSHSNSSSSSSTWLPVTPSQPLSSFTSCVQRCLQPQNQAPMSYMHYQNTQRLPVQPSSQRGAQHMQRLNGPHQPMQSNPVPFMHRSNTVCRHPPVHDAATQKENSCNSPSFATTGICGAAAWLDAAHGHEALSNAAMATAWPWVPDAVKHSISWRNAGWSHVARSHAACLHVACMLLGWDLHSMPRSGSIRRASCDYRTFIEQCWLYHPR